MMIYESNYIKLGWLQFPNNLVSVDGFYAEYQAKDYNDIDKTKQVDVDKIEEQRDKIFYEKNSKSIILQPDIMPIDMVGHLIDKDGRNRQMCENLGVEFKPVNIRGDWWDLYDKIENEHWTFRNLGRFEFKNSVGDPKRQLIFQSVVKSSDEKQEPVQWCIVAGEGRGYIQNETLRENQGIVFWIDENILPENYKNELKFYLFHRNPYNYKELVNGIYITIKEESHIIVSHYIDVGDKSKIPPQREILTQTQEGTLSAGKEIVEWGDKKTKVYVVAIIDKFILIGLNNLENCFVMECQNYDIGETPEGLYYPIILRENAELQITGKGQALFGLKKLAFFNEGIIRTEKFKTGYVLEDPYQITRVKRNKSDRVDRKWLKEGITDEDYKVYGEIKLHGQPMGIDMEETDETGERLNTYRKTRTETSPLFFKTKFIDEQRRDFGIIELPEDIDGQIISYTETASIGENNIISYYTAKIECAGSFGKMYSDILERKQIHGEPSIQLRGQENIISMGGFIFRRPNVSINNFENITLSLEGEETALFSLKRSIGYIISFDDMRITDVKAMEKICVINNIPFESDVSGIQLPETIEGKEGAFTFQPNVSFLEVLTELAKVQGYNLYTSEGIVYYMQDKIKEDITLGRSPLYPCEGISYENNDIYKSRIYVIGRAGENTKDYKRGEKLVGIWRSRNKIEKEIGYDTFVKEDEILTDWAMVQKEGERLWHRFNGRPFIIKFDLEKADEYIEKIKLFNVFKWVDEEYDFLNNKLFFITAYTKDISAVDCKATITGTIL